MRPSVPSSCVRRGDQAASLRHAQFAGCIHAARRYSGMANPDDLAALAVAFRKARYQVPELGDDGAFHVGATATALEAAIPAVQRGKDR